jgi:hypothetical protein
MVYRGRLEDSPRNSKGQVVVTRDEARRWFKSVADRIPADETRARRDVDRFCSLLEAVALCRSFSDGRYHENSEELEIDFSDYCVAFEILNDAFSSTHRSTHPQALRVGESVQRLYSEWERGVPAKELAKENGWELPVTYKWLNVAIKDKLIVLEPGTNEKNRKRYTPGAVRATRFLPAPQELMKERSDLEEAIGYLDPLTGKWKKLQRGAARGRHRAGHGKHEAA